MKVELKMPYYTSGFATRHCNCNDIAIAGATGVFQEKFYFYYLFLYSLYSNWNDNGKNLFDIRKKILFELGLKLSSNEIEQDEFVEFVKEKINSGNPVVLYSHYYDLFFLSTYREDHLVHALIINGYDDEKEIFYCRENLLAADMVKELTSAEPAFKIPLTYEMVKKIRDSYIVFNANNGKRDTNKVFFLEKVCENQICSKEQLLELLLDYLHNRNCGLSHYIRSLEQGDSDVMNLFSGNTISVRRDNNMSLYCIFRIIEEVFTPYVANKEEFLALQGEFIENRYNVISMLHAQSLRNKALPNSKAKILLEKTSVLNEKLYSYVLDHLKALNTLKSSESLKQIDLNSLASISADSVFNNNSDFKPSNVIKEYGFWRSNMGTTTHWLTVDLNESIHLKRVVIVHENSRDTMIQSFKFQTKRESEYYDLIEIKHNTDRINEFFVDSIGSSFRFLIEYPSRVDFSARIHKIEFYQ